MIALIAFLIVNGPTAVSITPLPVFAYHDWQTCVAELDHIKKDFSAQVRGSCVKTEQGERHD